MGARIPSKYWRSTRVSVASPPSLLLVHSALSKLNHLTVLRDHMALGTALLGSSESSGNAMPFNAAPLESLLSSSSTIGNPLASLIGGDAFGAFLGKDSPQQKPLQPLAGTDAWEHTAAKALESAMLSSSSAANLDHWFYTDPRSFVQGPFRFVTGLILFILSVFFALFTAGSQLHYLSSYPPPSAHSSSPIRLASSISRPPPSMQPAVRFTAPGPAKSALPLFTCLTVALWR